MQGLLKELGHKNMIIPLFIVNLEYICLLLKSLTLFRKKIVPQNHFPKNYWCEPDTKPAESEHKKLYNIVKYGILPAGRCI